jgi:sporulation protein YhbH
VGQGEGGTKPGDLLGQEIRGRGGGRGAGDLPGVDYYEAEITVDELAELVCEDLGLPRLRPREPRLAGEAPDFRDVRKKGLSGNLDRRRTLLEACRRSAREGHKACRGLVPGDLRYRAWDVTVRPEARAVVLAMMDTSGSMGTFEKYVARSFFFWMVRFLRAQYQNVEVVFLAHHTEARETTEEEFFTRAESGGTRCSSVYRLALEIIGQRFPPRDYNIYAFHFSDGDNLVADNELCVQLVLKLLEVANMVGYAEVEGSYRSGSSLRNAFKRIRHPRFVSVLIRDKTEVYQALRAFFGIHG